jgi:hypothetical protein
LEKKLELYQVRIGRLEARMKEENIPIELEVSDSSPFGLEREVIRKTHKLTPAEEQMMNNMIDQKKYKSEAEFKKIQNETLTK